MIVGAVTASLEAVVSIAASGPDGRMYPLDAVIDTGFSGYLTLPYRVIVSLKYNWIRSQSVILGDGSEQPCDVYEAEIVWYGQSRKIEVESADVQPLIGMALLEGYDLHIEVVEGGAVTIERL